MESGDSNVCIAINADSYSGQAGHSTGALVTSLLGTGGMGDNVTGGPISVFSLCYHFLMLNQSSTKTGKLVVPNC